MFEVAELDGSVAWHGTSISRCGVGIGKCHLAHGKKNSAKLRVDMLTH